LSSLFYERNTTAQNDWWKKAVFYQIYPRSFMDSNADGIGDLPGIISRLDYLNDGTANSLGIDAIWFSPFFTSPDFDFGYDIADYCAIDPRYGTMADFDRLVEQCRRRRIRVILDLVVNHSSIEHPWFKESRSSRDNPKRDWYIWRDGKGPQNRPPNNWRNNFFGPAWSWHEATGQYYLHSFLKEQPDLNWANQELRRAVYAILRFWLDKGAEGFRLDVAHHYCKDARLRDNPPFYKRQKTPGALSFRDCALDKYLYARLGLPELQVKKYNQHQPETHQVLKEFREILDLYPGSVSVGEVIGENPATIAAYYGHGTDELHLNFFFELLDCRWSAGAFRRLIELWEKTLPAQAWPTYTFSNHDQVRAISRYDRSGQGDLRARLLVLMLLTLRGTPFIYYGEEIGMKDPKLPKRYLKDPVGIRWYPFYRGRDGARTPMQWSGEAGGGFSDGVPWLPVGPELERHNVAAQESDPASLLSLYKRLIRLRKSSPALQEGSFRALTNAADPKKVFAYIREADGEKLAVALNFSKRPRPLNPAGECSSYALLLSTDCQRDAVGAIHEAPLHLAPGEGVLLRLS